MPYAKIPLLAPTEQVDYGLVSQNAASYLQVALVVCGHAAALVLAHDRALALFGQPSAPNTGCSGS